MYYSSIFFFLLAIYTIFVHATQNQPDIFAIIPNIDHHYGGNLKILLKNLNRTTNLEYTEMHLTQHHTLLNIFPGTYEVELHATGDSSHFCAISYYYVYDVNYQPHPRSIILTNGKGTADIYRDINVNVACNKKVKFNIKNNMDMKPEDKIFISFEWFFHSVDRGKIEKLHITNSTPFSHEVFASTGIRHFEIVSELKDDDSYIFCRPFYWDETFSIDEDLTIEIQDICEYKPKCIVTDSFFKNSLTPKYQNGNTAKIGTTIDSLSFSCQDEDYRFNGYHSINCIGGEWDHEVPTCERYFGCLVTKEFFENHRQPHFCDGEILEIGAKTRKPLKFSCENDYSIEEFPYVNCNHDSGMWDKELPICVKKKKYASWFNHWFGMFCIVTYCNWYRLLLLFKIL